MVISILTVCPESMDSFLKTHVIQRAEQLRMLKVNIVDIREYADGCYRKVDDSPFGGGRGLILRAEPVYRAISEVRGKQEDTLVSALTPSGIPFTQKKAHQYAEVGNLILVCGHYEGFDARLRKYLDEEISIGDYVLTGGELAAQVVADSVVRLLPGVLRDGSASEESFENGLLEYPQYTQPAVWRGQPVPDVLLSGDHRRIRAYRDEESKRLTAEARPDLFKKYNEVQ